jgi:serine protease AprX
MSERRLQYAKRTGGKMDPDIVKTARARLSNVLGEKLASKATDAFCLAYGQPTPALAAFEAAAERAVPPSVVLEFTTRPEVSDAINKAVEKVRRSKAWNDIRNALKKIEVTAPVSGVVTEVMESGRSEPEPLPIQAARLLRHVKVVSQRDNFFKVAGPITDTIEKSSQGLFVAGAEVAGPVHGRGPITQVCWLNRTVRSWSDPRSLAEVVADDSIERVDLPRRLEPDISTSGKTVGGPQFRKKFKRTGKGIIIAVIDGEVALTHPALKGRVVHKMNFTDEPWGNPNSHGTAVAGIIASNNGTFTGMAPEATIYSYKVLANNPALTGTDFDGSLAIQQALEDGAHIANCSWGNGPAGDGTSREARACDAAWAAGLVLVKSAGNRGPGPSTLTTPADAEGVIVVGATDRLGKAVQDYSSRGPTDGKQRPHLIAPGGIFQGAGIRSCLVGGGFGDCGAGTSFAAPHVAGILGLLLERDPNLTPDELRDILLNACKALSGVDVNTQGKGLVSLTKVN